MAKGGRRPGSGRKPGGKAKLTRAIRDYISEPEVKALVEEAKKMALVKPEIMRLLIEQLFGKAPQPVTGADGGPVEVTWMK